MDSGGNRKKPGSQLWSLTKPRACSELELRAAEVSDFSLSSLYLLPTPHPSSLQTSQVFSGLAECGESLGGQERPDLTDGSQHLNSSCYPSTCITDILLSYKHPEVSFSMEQAGV